MKWLGYAAHKQSSLYKVSYMKEIVKFCRRFNYSATLEWNGHYNQYTLLYVSYFLISSVLTVFTSSAICCLKEKVIVSFGLESLE